VGHNTAVKVLIFNEQRVKVSASLKQSSHETACCSPEEFGIHLRPVGRRWFNHTTHETHMKYHAHTHAEMSDL